MMPTKQGLEFQLVDKLPFNKPITEYRRGKSLDDFMAEMVRLKLEFNGFGKNCNQAVKKLITL